MMLKMRLRAIWLILTKKDFGICEGITYTGAPRGIKISDSAVLLFHNCSFDPDTAPEIVESIVIREVSHDEADNYTEVLSTYTGPDGYEFRDLTRKTVGDYRDSEKQMDVFRRCSDLLFMRNFRAWREGQ